MEPQLWTADDLEQALVEPHRPAGQEEPAVVARPIGAGQALTADDVLMVDYPDVLRPPCTFAAASDVVGRTRVRFGRFIDVTHRYRIDKDSFAFRRNEVDLTVGTTETYATLGYLKLDRNIAPTVEDLRDKEELRVAGRIKFAKYWSAFASTVLDLTDEAEDPLSLADGFAPARHRASINYEDECLELGLSWKRDYERIGDFRRGSTFSFHIGLKGLGR